MQNSSDESKVSELSYQGPLIGMRSTRPKPNTENPAAKKNAASEPAYERKIAQ
jgi:hypothetical protein